MQIPFPFFAAMRGRACIVCGAAYLGHGVCSDRNCARNGRRQRDFLLNTGDESQGSGEARPLNPVSPSPRAEPSAAAVVEAEGGGGAEGPTQEEMAELRGLLHELLELSTRISRPAGARALHREVETLERVVRVWGGAYIRWKRRMGS